MEVTVLSPEEMKAEAARFLARLSARKRKPERATVVGLSGELGAGKTMFVQAAAKALGISDTVASPTFVIEKIYALQGQPFDHLVHIDAYRLLGADELRALGWDDIVADPRNLIMLEWPENVAELLPHDTINVNLKVSGESKRKVTIK